MNINPHYIAIRAINLIESYKTKMDAIINTYETGKTLTCFSGIRPTIPVNQYPCFEIETQSNDTQWGTTRGQRHTVNFRCLISISCSKLDYREEYICTMASMIVSILQDPKNLQFPIECESPINGRYVLSVYDSMVTSVSYSSTKEGTIGVAEFTWVANVHEKIPDINFTAVPAQMPGIVSPIIKEVR